MLINPARNPSIFRRRFPIQSWYPSQHLLRQNPLPRSQFGYRRRFPRAASQPQTVVRPACRAQRPRGVGVRSDGTRRGNGLGSTLAMWAPAGIAAGFISPATSSGSAQISSRVESNGGRIKPKLLAILIWPSSLPPPGTANSATAPRLGLAGADFLRLRCPIIDQRSNGASQSRSCAK